MSGPRRASHLGGPARLGGKPASGYEGISRAGCDVGELVRALLDDSDED